jgi:hypothetical protein
MVPMETRQAFEREMKWKLGIRDGEHIDSYFLKNLFL